MKITSLDILDQKEPDKADDRVYAILPSSEEVTYSAKMTGQSGKKFKKWIRHIINCLGRRKRYEKRQKEWARRRRLKGARLADIQHE